MKVSDFGLIWRPFREYLQIKISFQKSGSVIFPSLWSPNFILKIRKILSLFWKNCVTNQPITNNIGLVGPRSKSKLYEALEYWSQDMLKFDFLEKGLEIVSKIGFCVWFFKKTYFSCYALLTDQISLPDCLYFLRYWSICVLQLFVKFLKFLNFL